MLTHHAARSLLALGVLFAAGLNHTQAQQFLQPANTQYLQHSQILGIPTSNCAHVIDLLMTNRMRQQTNQAGTPEVFLPHLTVGTRTGDLELLGVHLVCDGDSGKGPVFQISMRNNSTVPIGNFQVSLVAVIGQIHVHAPTATVRIRRMECDQETQVQVQLPVTCMSMHCVSGQSEFDTLIVALDSFDELLECDELNNVQILKRCDVPVLVVETAPSTPVPSAPVESPGAVVPQAPVPEAPAPEKSPLDELDLDNLDLNEAQSLLFQSR
ncbi:MAG: hypothetical protein R3C59_04875 [Planctomycetaceae bacterium]